MEVKIENWIQSSGSSYVDSRRAIHIILKAIADSADLSTTMVMKGGTLLGIRYGSKRFTTDVDFSTGQKLKDIDIEQFKNNFNDLLDAASAELGYGIKCKFQSYKAMPNIEGTFPTLKIKIGYAATMQAAHLQKLESGQAPKVISIDYSFNEQTYNTELLKIDAGHGFTAYAITDLIAEKIRSVLQQKIRERNREQDIYDLNFLLQSIPDINDEEKYKILDSLIKKSKGKGLDELLSVNGIRDPEIKRRSSERYPDLKDTVDGDLPDFELSFERVATFFESLPWKLFSQ